MAENLDFDEIEKDFDQLEDNNNVVIENQSP